MNNQDIFEGQANKWTWAAIDASDTAWLCEGKPAFDIRGRIIQAGLHAVKHMMSFDVPMAPDIELRTVKMWERETFMDDAAQDAPPDRMCVEPLCGKYAAFGDKRCTAHALPLTSPTPAPCVLIGCRLPKAENSKRCPAHSLPDGGPAVKPDDYKRAKLEEVAATGKQNLGELLDAVPALQKAKANAYHLYNREALTLVQFMAIFGEAPQ